MVCSAESCVLPGEFQILADDPNSVMRLLNDEGPVYTAAQIRDVERIDAVAFNYGRRRPEGHTLFSRIPSDPERK